MAFLTPGLVEYLQDFGWVYSKGYHVAHMGTDEIHWCWLLIDPDTGMVVAHEDDYLYEFTIRKYLKAHHIKI